MAEETQIDPHVEKYGVTEETVAQQREAHEAKSAEDLAFEAGQAASRDDYVREHGVDACPFPAGTERDAWLRGLTGGLKRQLSVQDLHAAVEAELSNEA